MQRLGAILRRTRHAAPFAPDKFFYQGSVPTVRVSAAGTAPQQAAPPQNLAIAASSREEFRTEEIRRGGPTAVVLLGLRQSVAVKTRDPR